MKTLLLFNDSGTEGGGIRNIGNISTALQMAGQEVDVIGYESSFWKFARTATSRARTCDVVIAIDMNPVGFVGYAVARISRAKFFIIAQAAYAVAPLYNKKTALFSQIVYRSADAIVAGSLFVANEIKKKVPGISISIIDPGIDLSKFPGISHPVNNKKTPYMIGVGAVKARKGYDVSMRAFALAKKREPTLRYVIVGSQTQEPGYFKELVDLARKLGVEDDVDFLTQIDDARLKDLYTHASLFILTSVNLAHHFEGFGMVFLEAAAYGLPSVGTKDNGIGGAIEDGYTGILVPQNDPEATAEAIIKILSDKGLATQMGVRAREFAQEHDVSHLVSLYSKLYNDTLDR